jgi:hypothetical protein
MFSPVRPTFWAVVFLGAVILIPALHAGNSVLGQVDLVATGKGAKTSGVWIDGQYIGYLGELKGSKKLLLLPGEHQITVRQGGYLDFVRQVSVRAGETQSIDVKMEKDARVQLPQVTSEIKLDVNPNRAAVFVDGVFVGHVAEFGGLFWLHQESAELESVCPATRRLKPISISLQIKSPR